MSNILVVAPHPDDETLGCGGTLLRHKNEGDEIHWLIMSTISEEAGYSQKSVEAKKYEIDEVTTRYNFASVHQTNFITTKLDTISKKELVSEVSRVTRRTEPDTIYVPYPYDVHSDHSVVYDAVESCTKSFRFPFIRKVRTYETLSETEFSIRPNYNGFHPNLWIDISPYLNKKIEIMRLYEGEMANHPFPRSEENIRALAVLRGSTAGVDAAEAFISLKEII